MLKKIKNSKLKFLFYIFVALFLCIIQVKKFSALCTNTNYNNYSVCDYTYNSRPTLGMTYNDYSTYESAFNNLKVNFVDVFPNDTFDFSDFRFVASTRYYRDNQQNSDIIFSTCPIDVNYISAGQSNEMLYTYVNCRSIVYMRRDSSSLYKSYYYYNLNNFDKSINQILNTRGNYWYNSYVTFWYSSNNSLNTNFFDNVSGFNTSTQLIEVDSSEYDFIVYNENLLENNSNWTKSCLSGQDTFFSILPTNVDSYNHDVVNNYVLFPYYINNLTFNWLQYNINNDSNIYENNYEFTDLSSFRFTSKQVMDNLLDNYYIQDFNTRYPSIYNGLYGWNMFLNRYQYTNDFKITLQVFHFDDTYTASPYCYVIDGSSFCATANGTVAGSGKRPDYVVNNPVDNNEICFYYSNDMYLKVWTVNEFGDITDSFNFLNHDYNVTTDSYENGYHAEINDNTYSGYTGFFNTLLSRLSVPIIFISSNITSLFNAMPIDFQYLIIGIISIGFFIGLIKFLTGGK